MNSFEIISWLVFDCELILAGKLTWLFAELNRDFFHYLGHTVPWLFHNVHSPHHAAYGRNYKVRSLEAYRKDRLTHALAESCFMLTMTSIAGGLGFSYLHFGLRWGCLFGIIHSLDELGKAIAGAIKPELGIKMDTTHTEGVIANAPRVDKVSPASHLIHHDLDLLSAFSGVSPIFDKLMGTARSYQKLTFGFMSTAHGLSDELCHCLELQGVDILMAPSCWTNLSQQEQQDWLNNVDVLVLVDF